MSESFDELFHKAHLAASPGSMKTSLRSVEQRWKKLRDQYLDLDRTSQDLRISLDVRYGNIKWASRSDRKKLETLQARKDKVAQKMLAILDQVSPRDWHHGVPSHWVYTSLTWEDATRPLNEKLSVTPPLSYGATHPKT